MNGAGLLACANRDCCVLCPTHHALRCASRISAMLTVVSDAYAGWYFDRALWRYFNRWLDNVFDPVSLACGDVAWIDEAWQRRHGDVMGAPNAGLQAFPPHHTGIPLLLAIGLNASRNRMSTHSAKLDIDHSAGSESDRRFSIPKSMDAFIQADGSLQLRPAPAECW